MNFDFTGLCVYDNQNSHHAFHEQCILSLRYLNESAIFGDTFSTRAKIICVRNTRPDTCSASAIFLQIPE